MRPPGVLELEGLPIRLRVTNIQFDLAIETFVDARAVVGRAGFAGGARLSRVVSAFGDERAGSGYSDSGGSDAPQHRTSRQFAALVVLGLAHVIGIRFHVS